MLSLAKAHVGTANVETTASRACPERNEGSSQAQCGDGRLRPSSRAQRGASL